jgi:hydrocephalus-inducing protein
MFLGSRLDVNSKAEARKQSVSTDKKRSESKSKRDGGGTMSPNRGSSSLSANKGEDNLDGTASVDGSSAEKNSQKLQRFRWVIPRKNEIVLRIRFTSEEVGQYDQTLNFEIVGTRRRYQLHCRGVCTFPSISKEPRF